MTQREFEDAHHRKRIRVLYPGGVPFEGFCTAALLREADDRGPLLAILGGDGDFRTYQLQEDLSDLQYFTVLE